MPVLSAQTIQKRGILWPCLSAGEDSRGCSYGLSACGYDLRVGEDVTITSPLMGVMFYIDALLLLMTSLHFESIRIVAIPTAIVAVILSFVGGYMLIKSFQLTWAMEEFNMPDDVVAMVYDKSSLARNGIAVQNTVAEPGWRGYLTLEITNHGWKNIRLKRGDAVAQVIFTQLDEKTTIPYDGKYQDQEEGAQLAR